MRWGHVGVRGCPANVPTYGKVPYNVGKRLVKRSFSFMVILGCTGQVAGVRFGGAQAPYLTLFGVVVAAKERPLLGRVGSTWERARPCWVSQGERMYFWLGRCDRARTWQEMSHPGVFLQDISQKPLCSRRELLIAQQRDPGPISCKEAAMLENPPALFLRR